MQKVVAISIANMLDAIPYQVELWDEAVIDHLVSHPLLLSRFDGGGEETKWNIYRSIKYGHHLA